MINLVAFIPRAVVQGIPLLFGSTGEIMTEKSGNLNLGIPGVMYVGAISGVMGSFFISILYTANMVMRSLSWEKVRTPPVMWELK